MKKGFQRAGKQPTKSEMDCIIVANYIRDNNLPKAIDFCMEQGIDEKAFTQIAEKVAKEKSKTEYFALIVTYNDDSQSICKGKRAISLNDETIDKNMLYTSYAQALKGKQAQESINSSLVKGYEIKPLSL